MAKTERHLTAAELRQALTVFRNAIDYNAMKIYEGKAYFFQPNNVAMAPDGNIYFPSPIYHPDFSISPGQMAFLLHEMTHVWQTQKGVWLRMQRVFVDGDDYDYDLDPAKRLQDYKIEEQASLVEDYYRLTHGLRTRHGSGPLADYATIVDRAMTA
jgi:hypothetical protein